VNVARRVIVALFAVALGTLGASGAARAKTIACPAGVDPSGSAAFAPVAMPPLQACTSRTVHGLATPDPRCTPGAINPSVGLKTLKDPDFRTGCERDHASSAAQKARTYGWYGIAHPVNNTGANQICELDHLISLELGGADSLDNLWPLCGPDGVALADRYFKQKDTVENYLAAMVKAGKIDIGAAQHGIATNWPQYLPAARAWMADKFARH